MRPNGQLSIMAQRHEPAESLDFFPTPPWATRALCEQIEPLFGPPLQKLQVWEPACGQGHMARPLAEYFGTVIASDIHDYGHGKQSDFFKAKFYADWIITNPPFNVAKEFALRAESRATNGVALLVRTSFLESVGRYQELFTRQKPNFIFQFSERVPMHKGRLVRTGSTATAYCWLVWNKASPSFTEFRWIPPCRKRLERDSDYAEARP